MKIQDIATRDEKERRRTVVLRNYKELLGVYKQMHPKKHLEDIADKIYVHRAIVDNLKQKNKRVTDIVKAIEKQ